MKAINPADNSLIREYPEPDGPEIEKILKAAQTAQVKWQSSSWPERAQALNSLAGLLKGKRDDLATLMAQEMGKPVAQGRAEADKCAWVCEYYAQNAQGFLAPEPVASDASQSYVSYGPLGIVLAVMPWNFPLWQVFRFAAPTLMSGNGALLKHASNVPGCALAIEQIFKEAGYPDHLFSSLLVGSQEVPGLIQDPRVAAVTLTGSTAAGRAVAALAGGALKKSVLELGGSDPYLILADADLDLAVPACVTSRLINSGQSCIAAKRFIVERPVLKEFTERMVAQMAEHTLGDPLRDDTKVGPQARTDLRDELHSQVERSVAQGARILSGGSVPERAGAWYEPTVLSGVTRDMPAFSEELFGPVAAIIEARDEQDAINKANDTVFGLGAAVFTGDPERGRRIAEQELQAGACFVNDFVKSDPRLPFGGIKESGYGRELGLVGMREFVNIKTVYVR